jgi:hypothetical protein
VDLALYARVIWRFRVIVAIGLVLALALALLSFVRVSFKSGSPHVAYRQANIWKSQETFLITSRGVPWARISNQSATEQGLAGLSAFYAQLANSDAVHRLLAASGPVHGTMVAQPAVDQITTFRSPLPFLSIVGEANTPSEAIDIASRGADAFKKYIVSIQNGAHIPVGQRVQMSVLAQARGATLLQGRKKTLPIVIFVTIMAATIGLAFILENLRPRVQSVDTVALDERRTA